MYFPPLNNTEDWHFSTCQCDLIAIQHLPEICLQNLLRERERKEKCEKRFVSIIFTCSSSVSKLFDSIILGDQKIIFLIVCVCVCS